MLYQINQNKHKTDWHMTCSSVIDCSSNDIKCTDMQIDCLPNEDCLVLCDDIKACTGSIINCPLNGDCDILCRGGESCRDVIINATLSSGNFNIECQKSTDHCKNIKIFGSRLQTNNGNFNVVCSGKSRSCINSEFKCPLNGDCTIKCNADSACKQTKIKGPVHGQLNIECNSKHSCQKGKFDAAKSSKLQISGCQLSDSCIDISVHCPPNMNGNKQCVIEGNDNLQINEIYAINGWNDVDTMYNGRFLSSKQGQMHCSEHYNHSCDIALDEWTCTDTNHYCANPTNISTISPTFYSSDIDFVEFNQSYEYDTNDIDYGDVYSKQYEPTKNRGISWLIEMRIIFGIGCLCLIIGMFICCWCHKKHHRSSRSSFYHHKATDPEMVPPAFEHHIHSIPLSKFDLNVNGHDVDNTKTTKSSTANSSAPTPFSEESSVAIPQYDKQTNQEEDGENIQKKKKKKRKRYHHYHRSNKEKKVKNDVFIDENKDFDSKSVQAQILAVRQLLKMRKMTIENQKRKESLQQVLQHKRKESLQRELQQKYFFEDDEDTNLESIYTKPVYKHSISTKKHENTVNNSTIYSQSTRGLGFSARNIFSPHLGNELYVEKASSLSVSGVSDSMNGAECTILHQMHNPTRKVHKAMTIMNAMNVIKPTNNNIRFTEKKRKRKSSETEIESQSDTDDQSISTTHCKKYSSIPIFKFVQDSDAESNSNSLLDSESGFDDGIPSAC